MNLHIRELLDAGVHFGHQANRWNPKMKRFIYGERNGVYIIDLQKTMDCLRTAYHFICNVVANGESVLFVGTKRQAVSIVEEAVPDVFRESAVAWRHAYQSQNDPTKR